MGDYKSLVPPRHKAPRNVPADTEDGSIASQDLKRCVESVSETAKTLDEFQVNEDKKGSNAEKQSKSRRFNKTN